jgi:RNA polymerase primary sigma factor
MDALYLRGVMNTLDPYMQDLDSRRPMDAAEERRLTLRLGQLRERLARLLEGLPEPHRRHILSGAAVRREMRFVEMEVIVTRLAREAEECRESRLQAKARQARAILQDLESARSTLINRNLRLVYHLARRFAGRGALLADIVQVGNLALLDAADRFDPHRGARFSTYAGACISAVIVRQLPGLTQEVHVPGYQIRLRSRLDQSRRSLTQDLGREPTLPEMAARACLGEDKAREIMTSRPTIVDLYARDADSERRGPADTLEAQEATTLQDGLILRDLIDHLQDVLGSLNPRLRTVLQLRYGLDGDAPRTLEEIGAALHLTRERIRQLEKEAMKLVRTRMRRLGAGGSTSRAAPADLARQSYSCDGPPVVRPFCASADSRAKAGFAGNSWASSSKSVRARST